MISMKELCSEINLQPEMTQKVLAYHENFEYDRFYPYLEKLFSPKTWDEGVKSLEIALGEDPSGIKMLTCMLSCALRIHKTYEEKGIPENIFADTMKFFTGAIDEHYATYGYYGFDRGNWTSRHISGNEFRIGVLEYEFVEEDGEKYIGIHIPSNTPMELSRLRQSYLDARKFLSDYFPEHAKLDMFCNSWLLSPALKDILPENSNILNFQKSFIVDHVDYETNAFLVWVYKKKNLPIEQLPEETTLQRRMKKYLLNGGKIGWANGKLIDNPFCN